MARVLILAPMPRSRQTGQRARKARKRACGKLRAAVTVEQLETKDASTRLVIAHILNHTQDPAAKPICDCQIGIQKY
jgi:hypothetical protein